MSASDMSNSIQFYYSALLGGTKDKCRTVLGNKIGLNIKIKVNV